MNFRKIYLVRHGEVAAGGQRRYIGQIDLPLNGAGRRAAAILRDELAGKDIGGFFCSDLERAVATAQIIAEKQAVAPVCRRDLREICLGAWEGLTFAEVREKYPGEFEKRGSDILHYRPPGGESFRQCARRVLSAWEDILNGCNGHILLVGHAGVNRLIISHVLGRPLENLFAIRQSYGCLNILALGIWGGKAIVLNRLPAGRAAAGEAILHHQGKTAGEPSHF